MFVEGARNRPAAVRQGQSSQVRLIFKTSPYTKFVKKR
ncbi:hypothetical protein BRPE64_ACDS10250 [Caballeronia insecticola]|uniref:Uncharacterized protein n=1 Tax=Caballeronia insecticola TaxID=758793 RepID=R4WGC3_9BURK|nr:hypothetical protein BRPE64_ACDS10250 [Caballeronia insecticola]